MVGDRGGVVVVWWCGWCGGGAVGWGWVNFVGLIYIYSLS